MKITQSWQRNTPSTCGGESLTLKTTYSSDRKEEIDEIQGKMPNGILVMEIKGDQQRELHEIRDKEPEKPSGLYQCFHCGEYAVVWGADFSFEDYGMDGEGIVHTLTCANCGAEIEYYISLEEEE